tara:strand:+ start:786 stop:998 length:213 start_codon:yes stop_codon:yes gene_type:complete
MITESSKRFASIVQMFAKYGFIDTPLNASEIDQLIAWGWDDEDIYAIGCDCASGFRFREALEYYPMQEAV